MREKNRTGGTIKDSKMHLIGEALILDEFPVNAGLVSSKSLDGNVSVTISASDCDKCPNCPGCPDQFEDYLS